MSRIVAIDYGRKRTGIAVSDVMQLIANGLTTVPTHQLLNFLGEYIAKEPVERLVVGLPRQMNHEVSENMNISSRSCVHSRSVSRRYLWSLLTNVLRLFSHTARCWRPD